VQGVADPEVTIQRMLLRCELTGDEVIMSGPTADTFNSCVVFMLGYPGMGKRTVGGHLAKLIDGVLVDNALINRPVLELFRWDGVAPLPPTVWDHVAPIRKAVLHAIEDVAPPSNSYVFTNVIEDNPTAADEYDILRSLAHRRGSLFLSVMLTCDLDIQVGRIDNADRVALRKGSDPEGYRGYTLARRKCCADPRRAACAGVCLRRRISTPAPSLAVSTLHCDRRRYARNALGRAGGDYQAAEIADASSPVARETPGRRESRLPPTGSFSRHEGIPRPRSA
jgi:hypothetical protein